VTPRILQEAEAELLEAIHWYDDREEGLGVDFFQQTLKTIRAIGKEPRRFPVYEGITLQRKLRRALVDRFPYVVIFEIRESEILIVAIVHTSRRPGFWQTR